MDHLLISVKILLENLLLSVYAKWRNFLIPDGGLRDKKNSSQLGRIITHLSDDISGEKSYASARMHILINRFLASLIDVIHNEVRPMREKLAPTRMA